MKKILGVAVVAAALVGSVAVAAPPRRNVSRARHPNLAVAQKRIDEAYERLTAAQKANEFDMEGHAAKAKDLLEEASKEIKLAAGAANENK